MKLTRIQLRKLIREMYSPNFEFMSDMVDVGSPMVNQIIKYLLPFKNNLKFVIETNNTESVEIKMFFNGIDIGEIAADYFPDCANCYIVGYSDTFGGLKSRIQKRHPFYDKIDRFFRSKGYGPILYELCLELVSQKGKDFYLTGDKNQLSPAAYNVWSYYMTDRDDVQKKILDPASVPPEYRISKNDMTDDCDGPTSEEYYSILTGRSVHAQGPDEDHDTMYKSYIDYIKTKDPIMRGYRKNSTPFLEVVNNLGMIK